METFGFVKCKTSEAWQGDCCPECEHDCWSDPERVEIATICVR